MAYTLLKPPLVNQFMNKGIIWFIHTPLHKFEKTDLCMAEALALQEVEDLRRPPGRHETVANGPPSDPFAVRQLSLDETDWKPKFVG